MPKSIKHHRPPRQINPFLSIGIMVLLTYLAGELFFLYAARNRPKGPAAPAPAYSTNWQPYTNTTYGYTFSYPAVINGPTTIREDLVEIYEEVEGLVMMINMIDLPVTPSAWLATQTTELFSQKPFRCFSRTEVTDIQSVLTPRKTLLHFTSPILFLDNVESVESKRGSCSNFPTVRIILIPHNDKLFKIIFSGTPLSEQMVSTFRFFD